MWFKVTYCLSEKFSQADLKICIAESLNGIRSNIHKYKINYLYSVPVYCWITIQIGKKKKSLAEELPGLVLNNENLKKNQPTTTGLWTGNNLRVQEGLRWEKGSKECNWFHVNPRSPKGKELKGFIETAFYLPPKWIFAHFLQNTWKVNLD